METCRCEVQDHFGENTIRFCEGHASRKDVSGLLTKADLMELNADTRNAAVMAEHADALRQAVRAWQDAQHA